MTGPQFQNPRDRPGNSNPFFTGKVAMSDELPVVDLWRRHAGDDWNVAAMPSYDGQTTAAFNADTFRILKGTKHPDEAFKVLTYLLGDAGAAHSTTAACRPSAEQDALLRRRSMPSRLHPADRLEGRQGRRPVRRLPQLRVEHARLQRSLDLLNKYRTQVAVHAGAGHGQRRSPR